MSQRCSYGPKEEKETAAKRQYRNNDIGKRKRRLGSAISDDSIVASFQTHLTSFPGCKRKSADI